MPNIENTPGGTVFNPSPAEVIANNRNKQQRREHKQLLEDVKVLKQRLEELEYGRIQRAKSIRKSRGKY